MTNEAMKKPRGLRLSIMTMCFVVTAGIAGTARPAQATEYNVIELIKGFKGAPGVAFAIETLIKGISNLGCQSWFQPMWDGLAKNENKKDTWDKQLEQACNIIINTCAGPPGTIQRAQDILKKIQEMRTLVGTFAIEDIGNSYFCRTYIPWGSRLTPDMTKFCDRLVPDLKDLLKDFKELKCTPKVQVGELPGDDDTTTVVLTDTDTDTTTFTAEDEAALMEVMFGFEETCPLTTDTTIVE